MYLDAVEIVEGAKTLKRKETLSMYSLAEILKPAQFHCYRPSLVASGHIKNANLSDTTVIPVVNEVEDQKVQEVVQLKSRKQRSKRQPKD
jgi:hypothetical protein